MRDPEQEMQLVPEQLQQPEIEAFFVDQPDNKIKQQSDKEDEDNNKQEQDNLLEHDNKIHHPRACHRADRITAEEGGRTAG